MNLNHIKVKELMEEYANGNYNRFARMMSLDPAHLHKFITTGAGGGKKVVMSVMKLCKDRNLDINEYIEL